MVCRYCGKAGHNIRTCIQKKEDETQNTENSTPTGNINPSPPTAPRRQNNNQITDDERIARNLQRSFLEEMKSIEYIVKFQNKTDYEIHIYILNIGLSHILCTDLIYVGYVEIFKEKSWIFNTKSRVLISKSCYGKETTIDKIKSEDILSFENINNINMNIEIKDKKTEIEKWKVSALKSQYLLQQIIKLGGMKCGNDAVESLLDLVQDIPFPKYNQNDLEHAGVPSQLTNIT